MPFSQEQKDAIIARIKERAPKMGTCPICHHKTFALADYFGSLSATDNIGSFALGGRSYPAIIITCENCGNTHMLNIHVLGLAETLGQPPPTPDEEQAEGKASEKAEDHG